MNMTYGLFQFLSVVFFSYLKLSWIKRICCQSFNCWFVEVYFVHLHILRMLSYGPNNGLWFLFSILKYLSHFYLNSITFICFLISNANLYVFSFSLCVCESLFMVDLSTSHYRVEP
uniref:Putative ovule protein n=1 Tax=Solanum chacoense TaxID=4108 RepID=A0A0V0IH61_SOLCH